MATPDLTAIALGEVRAELSNVHKALARLEATPRQLLPGAVVKEHETRKRPATEDEEEHQRLKAIYQTKRQCTTTRSLGSIWARSGEFSEEESQAVP